MMNLLIFLVKKNDPIVLGKEKTVVMMVGLQGSGKTTSTAKLANYLKREHGVSPLLVSADIYRPAAQDQLQILAKSVDIEYFGGDKGDDPIKIVKKATKIAEEKKS